MQELSGRIELRGVIHVVHARLDCVRADAGELLDPQERARAERRVDQRVRARFVASHAALRLVLARFLDCSPVSLRFDAAPGQKPSLAWPASDLRFSLSHSGERAIVAVASGVDVGVDIEQEREVEALRLARRFFAPREAAVLEALPPLERRAAFFRIWTRKEAVVKASGDGLRLPLSTFEIALDDDEARVKCRSPRDERIRAWRVVPLEVERGYAAALAAEDGAWRATAWEFTHWQHTIR